MATKPYSELLDDLESYNERTKAATEDYEQKLGDIDTAVTETSDARDEAVAAAGNVTYVEERLLGPGSSLYRGTGTSPEGNYVQNGDAVPAGTTHLSAPINGKPEDVAISPLASGVVSGLTETGATIGGVSVVFDFGERSFNLITDIVGVKHPSTINVKGFSVSGIGAGRWVTTGNTGAENYTPVVSASGDIVVVTSDGVEIAYKPEDFEGNVASVGVDINNTTGDDQQLWNDVIANNSSNISTWMVPPKSTLRMSVFRVRNQEINFGAGNQLRVFYGGLTPTLGQVNEYAIVRGCNAYCEELDLENCRIQLGDHSQWLGGTIVGFRNPTNGNGWGVNFRDAKDVRLIGTGFDDNTQSDIAFINDNDGVTIEGCYPINSTLHINLEPNLSTTPNRNISLRNMRLSKLSLLENGSGGTANSNISVENVSIETLFYDGAKATIKDSNITNFEVGQEIFFGELELINSLSIGPNVLIDPYMINVGSSRSGENPVTNGNDWTLGASSGVSPGIEKRSDNGVRYTRMNPSFDSGSYDFRLSVPISVDAGSYWLVAVTGRRVNGSSAKFVQIYNGVQDKNCRLFRTSNDGVDYFTTEIAIVPAGAAGDFVVKIGQFSASDGPISCDIAAISVHRVLGKGNNVQTMLDKIHNLGGRRYIERSVLPTLAVTDQDVVAFQPGDTVDVGKSRYVYDSGTSFDLISQA